MWLSAFSTVGNKDRGQKQPREERVRLAYLRSQCTDGSQCINSRTTLKQNLQGMLFTSLLHIAFSACPDDLHRDSTTLIGLSPPKSVINQENVIQTCLQAIWWRHFLKWGSSCQIHLGLHCVVKKTTTTVCNNVLWQPVTIRKEKNECIVYDQ